MTMTPEVREQMNLFWRLIQEERDPKKLVAFVKELNHLLAAKEEPIAVNSKQERLQELGRG